MNRLSATFIIATLLTTIVLVIGCGKNNQRPVVVNIIINPADSVPPGTLVSLKAVAADPDGDELTFNWLTDVGTLLLTSGDSVVWQAPDNPGTATVKVICTDGSGGVDTGIVSLHCRNWRYDNVEESYDGEVSLPNPGTVEVALNIGGSVSEFARVESLWITVNFEPDSLDGEFFQMWLISPSGQQVLFWDHRNGNIGVDGECVPGFTNEPVRGNWRLKITREVSGEEAYLEEFNLDIDYRW